MLLHEIYDFCQIVLMQPDIRIQNNHIVRTGLADSLILASSKPVIYFIRCKYNFFGILC
ncbi:hypothetical protein D3C80_2133740 [compost metagenome]